MKNLILAIGILVSGLVTAQDDWRDSYEEMFYGDPCYDSIAGVYYKVVPFPTKKQKYYKGVFDMGGNDFSYIIHSNIDANRTFKDIERVYEMSSRDLAELDFDVSEHITMKDLLEMHLESIDSQRSSSKFFSVKENIGVIFYIYDTGMYVSIKEYN